MSHDIISLNEESLNENEEWSCVRKARRCQRSRPLRHGHTVSVVSTGLDAVLILFVTNHNCLVFVLLYLVSYLVTNLDKISEL